MALGSAEHSLPRAGVGWGGGGQTQGLRPHLDNFGPRAETPQLSVAPDGLEVD